MALLRGDFSAYSVYSIMEASSLYSLSFLH